MKIGLSYSRCVLDIVEERVNIEDVLIVISRTNFDPRDDKQWHDIWSGYCHGGMSRAEWGNYDFFNKEDEDKFRSVSIMLYEDGKLHQPRQFGSHPRRMQYYWLETMLPSSEIDRNPALKKAFEQFKIIAELTNTKLDKEAH